jgi:CheY-like chemotaxis protein
VRYSGIKVLVVDDNLTNLRILQEMLSRWKMEPVVAACGVEALAALELARRDSVPFQLILLNRHMPHMDGFTLIERIRQMSVGSLSSIVMLTSGGHRGDAERCRELGVAAYLLKPIRQCELREALALVIQGSNRQSTLPVRQGSPVQETRTSGQTLSILVAEDNPVIQRLMLRTLEKRGHRIKLASNGMEVLRFLERETCDLILMDIQMPEMDGITATTHIRERERASGTDRHIPIIALTAHAMKGDQERFLAAGMDGYLSKPFRPHELDDILVSQLNARGVGSRSAFQPDPQLT